MPRKIEPHFLEKNSEYLRKYNELLKEIRVWNSCGQYWLSQEAERRAKCLLNGNIEDYQKQTHSHELAYPQVIDKYFN
tara:strand:+ start:328 stop:561 length:234 start_codon:yes stop_codon:yes gene_type:complete